MRIHIQELTFLVMSLSFIGIIPIAKADGIAISSPVTHSLNASARYSCEHDPECTAECDNIYKYCRQECEEGIRVESAYHYHKCIRKCDDQLGECYKNGPND